MDQNEDITKGQSKAQAATATAAGGAGGGEGDQSWIKKSISIDFTFCSGHSTTLLIYTT